MVQSVSQYLSIYATVLEYWKTHLRNHSGFSKGRSLEESSTAAEDVDESDTAGTDDKAT